MPKPSTSPRGYQHELQKYPSPPSSSDHDLPRARADGEVHRHPDDEDDLLDEDLGSLIEWRKALEWRKWVKWRYVRESQTRRWEGERGRKGEEGRKRARGGWVVSPSDGGCRSLASGVEVRLSGRQGDEKKTK